jgi:hypothetical protein
MENITVSLGTGIIAVDRVPDCFMTRSHAQAHFNSWANVPQEENLEASAFPRDEDEDYSGAVTIGYDCIAFE